MGGGSSATPTTPPGYTGGSVMDYSAPGVSTFQSSGVIDPSYSALGTGLQRGLQGFGQSIAAGSPPPSGAGPSLNYPAALQLPTPGQSGGGINDEQAIFEMLRRLLGGG